MNPFDPMTRPKRSQPEERLEPEFAPLHAAYKRDPGPRHATALLKAVDPILDTGIKAYAPHSDNPNLRSHARRLALGAFKTYDPTRAALKTHLLSQLQGLRRYAAKQTQIIAVPERVALQRQHLDAAERELEDELGRPPSSMELADRTGVTLKRQAYVRQYVPGFAEGQVRAMGTGEEGGPHDAAVATAPDLARRLEFLYPDLDPRDQAIVEHGFGLHGRRTLRVGQLAAKLGVTPGAISQRTAKLQKMLDELDDAGLNF
jgi:DNA-directed RNA polymerase specialized sigma subunit